MTKLEICQRGICSRKVPGTLNSCNNQNCFSPMGVDILREKRRLLCNGFSLQCRRSRLRVGQR